MRICLLYDALQPYRIGGAERWYYSLTERLSEAGHDVTYVTLRQWPRGEVGRHPTATVIAVGPRLPNYGRSGNRTFLPPILFGLGVWLHLMRHGRRYDVVHTSSFPYFSLLAAAAAQPFGRYRIVTDWLEFWSKAYWTSYIGPLGWLGWTIQALCLRVRQHAFCLARVTAGRLRANRVNGPVEVLTGIYAGSLAPRPTQPGEPRVIFAGRLIREKRVLLAIEAMALAAQQEPRLKGSVFGIGPEAEAAQVLITDRGWGDVVRMEGLADRATLEDAMGRATCLLHPSEREGYGLVVVEAAVFGTPSILVAGDDNAATDLVDDGVNGYVVAEPSAALLAEAILRAWRAGDRLRQSTTRWLVDNGARLSISDSLAKVIASYAPADGGPASKVGIPDSAK